MISQKPAHALLLALIFSTAAMAADAPAPLPADARKAIDQALDAYEKMRAALVDESIDAITAAEADLASAAEAATPKAPKDLATQAEAFAKTTTDLKATPTDNLLDVRKAFGEVSRAVVALAAASPELQSGRYVKSCPMAPGYKKWVQTAEKTSNPYMGKRMPICGVASDWK